MVDRIHTQTLQVTPELEALIHKIDAFKAAWPATAKQQANKLDTLRQEATLDCIGSSCRIDAVKISNAEISKLLTNDGVPNFKSCDEEEAAGYAVTLAAILSEWQSKDVSKHLLRQSHRNLLQFSSKDSRNNGEYKINANPVERPFAEDGSGGLVYKTATPFSTARLMAELLRWHESNSESGKLHPLVKIAVFIAVFLSIHPFQAANGRMSRLLITLLMQRAGYTYMAYSSIDRIIEENKAAYFESLTITQPTIWTNSPDWQPWLTFFLGALEEQTAALDAQLDGAAPAKSPVKPAAKTGIKAEKKAAKPSADKASGKSTSKDLPELSLDIINVGKKTGRVTVASVVDATGVSRNTIKDHIKALTAAGKLEKHGAGRGTWYSLN